jgi:hypothetical protein
MATFPRTMSKSIKLSLAFRGDLRFCELSPLVSRQSVVIAAEASNHSRSNRQTQICPQLD